MSQAIEFSFACMSRWRRRKPSLHLAMFAVEGLVGPARVQLDGRYQIDEADRVIHIHANGEIGDMLARVFTGFLLREFDEQSFQVSRVDAIAKQPEEAAA